MSNKYRPVCLIDLALVGVLCLAAFAFGACAGLWILTDSGNITYLP